MGGFGSIWHWVIVLIIVLLLFGAGKLPRLMGDMAKGVKAFKAGLKEEGGESGEADAAAKADPKPIDQSAQTTMAEAKKDEAAKH
ncbi:MAG: twin-arginine translocase TatA/TatE family subunit [Alphaproteobacteria bacterium]|nr:twin-arginine translocase TatA/TatE family subunit [Alphaproteobacteria bacterium]